MTTSLLVRGDWVTDETPTGEAQVLRNLLAGLSAIDPAKGRAKSVSLRLNMQSATSLLPMLCRHGFVNIVDPQLAVKADVRLVLKYVEPYSDPPWVLPDAREECGTTVTVVHDLRFEHPPYSPARERYLSVRPAFVEHLTASAQLIAVSNFTKQEIGLCFGPTLYDKTQVIPNPIDWSRFGSKDDNYAKSLPENYVKVCFGSQLSDNKLVDTFLDAFLQVRAVHPKATFLATGRPRSRMRTQQWDEWMGKIVAMGLRPESVFLGFVSDEQLGNLHRSAQFTVYPTNYEGFGMPAVEAMGLGKPVITSGLPSLKESTLGAAMYIDQYTDSTKWAEAMIAALDNPDALAPPKETVSRLHEIYSPPVVAAQYLDLLTSL